MSEIIENPVPGEPFWMIERIIEGAPHWWKRKDGQCGDAMLRDRWTSDANEARKYASKAAAEYVMGTQMSGCVATEHLFISRTGELPAIDTATGAVKQVGGAK